VSATDIAAAVPHSEVGHPTAPRLLVVADAVIADVNELPPLVRSVIDGAGELYVVTPTLLGRLDWLASQTNPARHAADERLDRVLGQLRSIGAHADGRTGDEDILTAFADAVAEFRPDHILIALRSAAHANWQERGLIAHVRERFDRPLTTFSLDEQGRVSIASAAEPAGDLATAGSERVDPVAPAAVGGAESGRPTERDGLTVLAFFAFASLMMVAGVGLAGAIDSWWALASVVVVDFILVTGVMLSVFALLND
jgi:hypothetical protein